MDRNYFHQKITNERQRDLARDLATRRMLKQADGDLVPVSHPKRLILVGVPAVVAIALLIMLQLL